MFVNKDKFDEDNNFNSELEIHNLSYMSCRRVNPLYNVYNKNEQFQVTGFISASAQYDGRLHGNSNQKGEGFDLESIDPNAYDKLTFCYFALVGDQGEKKHIVEKSANDLKLFDNKYWPVADDTFGACQSNINVGFKGWGNVELPQNYNINQCQGLLGGLSLMKQKNPKLKLECAIGGWLYSQPFHHMVKSPENRKLFINGVVDLLHRFPIFNSILIDWEYPGSHGAANNEFSENDGENYCQLIKELRMGLKNFYGDINITLPATIDQLSKVNASNLILNGVSNIYLLTLDYFGGWSSELKHDSSLICIQQAVDYLIGVNNINPKCIHISYRTSSKNAIGTEILSWSPLVGKFQASFQSDNGVSVVGTFEDAVTSFNDIIINYIDFENAKMKPGFKLHYDAVSKAYTIYNQKTKLFMTLDTPKSVKDKAEYVREKGLGGLFTQSVSGDASGLLVNASNEGLGGKLSVKKVDMEKLYDIQN